MLHYVCRSTGAAIPPVLQVTPAFAWADILFQLAEFHQVTTESIPDLYNLFPKSSPSFIQAQAARSSDVIRSMPRCVLL